MITYFYLYLQSHQLSHLNQRNKKDLTENTYKHSKVSKKRSSFIAHDNSFPRNQTDRSNNANEAVYERPY